MQLSRECPCRLSLTSRTNYGYRNDETCIVPFTFYVAIDAVNIPPTMRRSMSLITEHFSSWGSRLRQQDRYPLGDFQFAG